MDEHHAVLGGGDDLGDGLVPVGAGRQVVDDVNVAMRLNTSAAQTGVGAVAASSAVAKRAGPDDGHGEEPR